MKNLTLVVLVVGLTLPAVVHAQESTETLQSELRTLVSDGVGEAEQDRAVIQGFLGREDVTALARHRGLSLERARSGVSMLSAEDAGRVADRVKEVQDQLAGGDTFVISTTTIIIALLVVILIVVA